MFANNGINCCTAECLHLQSFLFASHLCWTCWFCYIQHVPNFLVKNVNSLNDVPPEEVEVKHAKGCVWSECIADWHNSSRGKGQSSHTRICVWNSTSWWAKWENDGIARACANSSVSKWSRYRVRRWSRSITSWWSRVWYFKKSFQLQYMGEMLHFLGLAILNEISYLCTNISATTCCRRSSGSCSGPGR